MNQSKFINRWFPLLIGLGVWLWSCWPMMAGQMVAGFRDSAYLYYPLFEWIDAQWMAGDFPLWNPYCNFGMPMVGDSTPALLYPGKAVFFCSYLSFPSRYGIYLSLHLLLAGVGTYWLARILKANPAGATLAAISYAYGGCVVGQVNNVIFLVSAAWLPFALACVWQMYKVTSFRKSLPWAVGAGACCGLMILGGDPQMVYHLGLIAAATGASRVFQDRQAFRRRARSGGLAKQVRPQSSLVLWGTGRSLGLVGVMVGVTIVLSLAQLWPSYEWSKLSERTQSATVANLYQVVAKSKFDREGVQQARQALIGPLQKGTVARQAYQFSLPPWSLADLFWPNASGKMYPKHQRWTDLFPGADLVWFPSLYVGLFTVLLALGGVRFFVHPRQRWLTRIGLFFCVASFGWYGCVWLINEFLPPHLRMATVGQQVGGLYWLMNIALPKYFSFRYPAKLFLVTSLCLSLLAGIQLRTWRLDFMNKGVRLLGGLTLFGGVFVLLGFQASTFNRVPINGMFGPFDDGGASRQMLISFAQTGVLLLVALWISKRWGAFQTRGDRTENPKGANALFVGGWAVVLLTAIDLTLANRWLLAEIPASAMNVGQTEVEAELEIRSAAEIEGAAQRSPLGVLQQTPLTLYRPRGSAFIPKQWGKVISSGRLAEAIVWKRETYFPKHHLVGGVRLLGSFASIWPTEYETLMGKIEERDEIEERENGEERDGIEEREGDPTNTQRDDVDVNSLPDWKSLLCDAELRADTSEPGRHVRLHWSDTPAEVVFLTPVGFAPDTLKGETYWESAQSLVANVNHRSESNDRSKCECVHFGNNSLEMNVSINEKRWLVHNSISDGNWQARVENRATGKIETLPLVELVDCFQGIPLRAGEYTVTFSYQPTAFWSCVWISSFGWGLAILLGLFSNPHCLYRS